MSTQELFDSYVHSPRVDALAPKVVANARKAWMAVFGTFAAAMLIGVPFSFVRFRRSLPWEPIDMLWAGLIIAAFTVPIAIVVAVIMGRYVTLFRTGRMLTGTVVQPRGSGVVLHVATGRGPDRTFVPEVRLPVGQSVPVLASGVGSLVLVVVAPGDLRRGSLLTEQQLSQLLVA